MKKYIFLTAEGYTFQPNRESPEPDIDNLQVIGFARGNNSKEAFWSLVKENSYLLETTFDEIFCYELAGHYEKTQAHYYLKREDRVRH
ncbi:MAG: hypothetical protein A3K83_00845 [Omnitrophica WOR_2 bacterium RBG_13_44_8b]|nr:MAG: hypothetical protein A3K83_00845 [Omnitrophica WOR_2 bacterium RBG_13_44_8b]